MQYGGLTVADLAVWFDRPYATVRQWVSNGRAPRGPQGALVVQRLDLLVGAISDKNGFPLDQTTNQHERPQIIERIRNELERAGVLARDPP